MRLKIATALRVEVSGDRNVLGQPRNPVNIDKARENYQQRCRTKGVEAVYPGQSRGGVDRRYEIDESPKRQNWRPISLVTLLRPATFRISNLILQPVLPVPIIAASVQYGVCDYRIVRDSSLKFRQRLASATLDLGVIFLYVRHR